MGNKFGPAELYKPLRELAKYTIENPSQQTWSYQGFGMLRCYLDPLKEWRLNMWRPDLAVEDVSVVHDHPWSFDSWILCGEFMNVRFHELPLRPYTHNVMTIKTGEGGGPTGDVFSAHLYALHPELYYAGDFYHQNWDEIHMSVPQPGTVTINRRARVGSGEHARVYWPHGEDWIDAEPRPATETEVAESCLLALQKIAIDDKRTAFIEKVKDNEDRS